MGRHEAGRRASRSQFWYAFYLHSGMHAFICYCSNTACAPVGRAPYCVRFAMPAGLISEIVCRSAEQRSFEAKVAKNMSNTLSKWGLGASLAMHVRGHGLYFWSLG